MVSLFKEKSTAAVFGIIIISAGLRAFFWQNPPQVITNPGDGFIYYFLEQFKLLPATLLPVIYHLVVIIQAMRLNYVLNEVRLFPKVAFTTALAYILLTALIPGWNNISSALIVNSLVILLIYRMVRLYNAPNPKTLLYNIGLITGSTVLLYFPAVPFVIVAFFALGTLRPFRVNEWITLLFGILTPFYFLTGWLFLNDKFSLVVNQLKMFTPQNIRTENLLLLAATLGVAVVAVVTGFFYWQSNNGRMVIQVRKSWSILFTAMLLVIPVVFIMDNTWPEALLLATVPAAAFVSNTFLYPKKNFFTGLLFWILAGLIVYNNWFVLKF